MCTSHIYSPLEDHCVSLVFCSSVPKCNYMFYCTCCTVSIHMDYKRNLLLIHCSEQGTPQKSPQYFYHRIDISTAVSLFTMRHWKSKNYNTLLIMCCGFYNKHVSSPFCLRCCTYNNNWVFAFHLRSQLLELIPLLSSLLLVWEYDLRFPQQ
jgi:hypothetical protein